MVKERFPLFVDPVPNNLLGLGISWENIVVGADALHHLLNDKVETGFVLAASAVGHPGYAADAAIYSS